MQMQNSQVNLFETIPNLFFFRLRNRRENMEI